MTDEEKAKVFELVKQAKEGNEIAFTKLYNRFKQTVYNTAYFIVRNKDAADDLVSTTFIKAFQRIQSYVNNISFEMWLKTIAINSSIDYIRRTRKEKANYFIDDEDNYIQLGSSADYSPEEVFIGKETSARLDEAMTRLRWKYRNIIELRTVKNMSYKQISDELGMSESQVKTLLNKARNKLKELLN